jgi:L-ascorbate metabolism protein UlaG (beta-lactamase superfamily)
MAEIRWYGHNCFRIRAKEATILTDPVDRSTGYAMGKQNADIVTISDEHAGNINLNALRSDFQTIRGPGEYEMHDVFITGIRTYRDERRRPESGYNTIYLIEVEGLKIGHLGNLGHGLSDEQAEIFNTVDLLMIAAGGGGVLGPEKAGDLVTQLSPKAVIPMRYATPIGDKTLDDASAFVKQLGVEIPEPIDKLVVRPSDLADTLRLIVFQPESEPARR